ncbi:hypothetical protein [Aquimarina sp. AU58]|uniref:hypothetical protein n=1 Tax=Aquimarina sp. AU58 TaxID=1874112 RepID=UPI00135952E6|nr:hypothetical protein [Aquimarina sp. AU58]
MEGYNILLDVEPEGIASKQLGNGIGIALYRHMVVMGLACRTKDYVVLNMIL